MTKFKFGKGLTISGVAYKPGDEGEFDTETCDKLTEAGFGAKVSRRRKTEDDDG